MTCPLCPTHRRVRPGSAACSPCLWSAPVSALRRERKPVRRRVLVVDAEGPLVRSANHTRRR